MENNNIPAFEVRVLKHGDTKRQRLLCKDCGCVFMLTFNVKEEDARKAGAYVCPDCGGTKFKSRNENKEAIEV